MELRNYYDFAMDDYRYVKGTIEDGRVANAIGNLSQGVCEKFLKHLVDCYDQPQSNNWQHEHDDMMRTHSLSNLAKYLNRRMGIALDGQARTDMDIIDGFYFNTKYPGDSSITIDEEDVKKCLAAMDACRREVDRIIAEKEACSNTTG